MKDWFEYFGTVFSRSLCQILKNIGYIIISCLLAGIIILSFGGTGLCIYHLSTGEALVSNWLYASPVVFVLALALLKTYLDW